MIHGSSKIDCLFIRATCCHRHRRHRERYQVNHLTRYGFIAY